MRYVRVASRGCALALAAVATTVVPASARPTTASSARCTSKNTGITAATEVTGNVTVAGKKQWKSLKRGNWVITDDHGSVDVCVDTHRTFCRVGASSYVRVRPPKPGVLLRFGLSADANCFQSNTRVELSEDKAGYYLAKNAQPGRTTTAERHTSSAHATPSAAGDPIFAIHVKNGVATIGMLQGAAIVDTGATEEDAVVAGRNQQVTARPGAPPSSPKGLTKANKAGFEPILSGAPKDSDHTAPAFTVTGPAKLWSVRSVHLEFQLTTQEAGVTFTCALDSKDFRLCKSPVDDVLDPGSHDFAVRVTDSKGNSRVQHHTWTIEGSRIVFGTFHSEVPEVGDNPEIDTADPDGTNVFQVTRDPRSDEHPVWSPDRKRIAFDHFDDTQNLDIWTIAADGSDPQRITTDPARDANPSWSRDGTTIAFERGLPPDPQGRPGDRQIWVVDLKTGSEKQLTADNPLCKPPCPVDNFDPAWSPDGTKIAFASNRDGNDEIYVMNADGTDPTDLTKNPANDFGPSWSRDGKYIAFNSNLSGPSQDIWIMSADGSSPPQRVTTDDSNSDTAPAWAPDSIHLVYESNRPLGKGIELPQLYVVDAFGGPPPTPFARPFDRLSRDPDW
jgi:hypothetical protein